MDVNAYLKRINYHGPIDNTFETLQNLCECHNNTVPFDTLDMYGGERIELELHKVYEKIVDKGRGGLRYEVNGLLHWLLQKLGFLSEIIQAQWFQIDTFLPKFDHMLLLVTTPDRRPWLVDVCWGAVCYKHPLELVVGKEQTQTTGIFKVLKCDDDDFVLQRRFKSVIQPKGTVRTDQHQEWRTLYKFDCIPRRWSDFKLRCDFQQDDESAFLNHNTCCFIYRPEGSFSLWGWWIRGKRFIDHSTDKIVMLKKASGQEELKRWLIQYFGIKLNFHIDVQARDQPESYRKVGHHDL